LEENKPSHGSLAPSYVHGLKKSRHGGINWKIKIEKETVCSRSGSGCGRRAKRRILGGFALKKKEKLPNDVGGAGTFCVGLEKMQQKCQKAYEEDRQ